MSSRRCLRVARLIKEIVSRVIIFELADPRMGFVTVTEVEVAPDLKAATVKLSVMGEQKQIDLCMKAVHHAAGRIQGEVNAELGMKIVPRLQFELDNSIKKSVEISRLIAKAASEYHEEPAADEPEEPPEGASADEADDSEETEEPEEELS